MICSKSQRFLNKFLVIVLQCFFFTKMITKLRKKNVCIFFTVRNQHKIPLKIVLKRTLSQNLVIRVGKATCVTWFSGNRDNSGMMESSMPARNSRPSFPVLKGVRWIDMWSSRARMRESRRGWNHFSRPSWVTRHSFRCVHSHLSLPNPHVLCIYSVFIWITLYEFLKRVLTHIKKCLMQHYSFSIYVIAVNYLKENKNSCIISLLCILC